MILREALPWIFALSLTLFVSLIEKKPLISLLILSTIIFISYFFRDPERTPEGEGYLAPADGRVTKVDERRISIFMGLRDVHVNRSPYDGVIKSVEKSKGSHFPAFLKNSDKNERNVIVMETKYGNLILTQIVGFFARRIVCKVKKGDRVRRGERIGYICFGSRVDVIFPEGTKIYVREGDKVKAGETVVAVPLNEKSS
jgi:phosphatidylserine decarboxylase